MFPASSIPAQIRNHCPMYHKLSFPLTYWHCQPCFLPVLFSFTSKLAMIPIRPGDQAQPTESIAPHPCQSDSNSLVIFLLSTNSSIILNLVPYPTQGSILLLHSPLRFKDVPSAILMTRRLVAHCSQHTLPGLLYQVLITPTAVPTT